MKMDFRWRGWIVLASLLVTLVILSTPRLFNGPHQSTAHAASKPSISAPAVIRAFHPFKISGKGFVPGDVVTIYSTAPIGTFKCGNNGSFTGTAIVDSPIVQGTYQLSAVANSNLTATTNYTYLPGVRLYDNNLAILKKGGPGTLIFLEGVGFNANEAVNIYWGKNAVPIMQATTDSNGILNSYNARFNAPTNIAPGKYPITVQRTQQEPEAVSTTFTILPPKLISSGGILAGQAINVKLSGFQANEQVAISWNVNGTQTIATIPIDSNGAATTSFIPPSAPKGPHSLKAIGSISGLQATSVTNIGPGISLDPNTVNVTGTTTVNGGGYKPGETVHVYLQNTSNGVITTIVNAQGGFSVPLTAPTTYQANTAYYVYAVSSNGSDNAKAQLFFQPPSITDNGDEVYGGSLTITGQGFANGETVTLSWQSITDASPTQLGTIVAAPDGTFAFTTTVPGAPYTTSGYPFPFNATITAQGTLTQIQTSTRFFVIHNIIATPTAGTIGSTIALAGGGFGSTEQVDISLQGIPLTTVTTDANGSFNTTFVVPPHALPGTRASNLDAVGNTSHLANDISFGVLMAITITPQQGPSGSSITVSGTGFVPGEQVTIEWVDPSINRGTVLTTFTLPSFTFTTTVTAPANLTSGATYYVEVTGTFNTSVIVKAAFTAQ